LVEETKYLLDGNIHVGKSNVDIPLIRLNELISSMGVDRHRFTDTFKLVKAKIPTSLKIIHGGEEEQRQIMVTSPNAFVIPIIDRGKRTYEENAGYFLLPNRIRIDTTHVISMLSNEPTISNIFYTIKLKNESLEKLKSLCLWLNTTWGILTVLASREDTHGGFIGLNMSQWRLLPVLNVDILEEKKLESIAGIFDQFKNIDLGRIPEQYDITKDTGQGRIQLDLAFLKALGIVVSEADLLSLYKSISTPLAQWLGE